MSGDEGSRSQQMLDETHQRTVRLGERARNNQATMLARGRGRNSQKQRAAQPADDTVERPPAACAPEMGEQFRGPEWDPKPRRGWGGSAAVVVVLLALVLYFGGHHLRALVLDAHLSAPDGTSSPSPQRFRVANTDGEGVYLSRTPTRGNVVAAYPEGTPLERIGDDSIGDEGWTWRRVQTPDGVIGWVPAQFTIVAV